MTVLNLPVEQVENLEALVVSLNGEFNPELSVWDQLESEHPDFSFFQDVHMDSLVDTLTEGGLDESQITTLSLSLYGPVIDFYQVGSGEDELFVMAVGQR